MSRRLTLSRDESPQRAGDTAPGSVWIDLQDPDGEELRASVGPMLPLPPSPAGLQTLSLRPRLSVYDACVQLTFATPAGVPLTVYLGDRRVVTVHARPLPEVDAIWQQYLEARHSGRNEPADLALYRVLDRVLQGFEADVERLVEHVEALNVDPRSLREEDALHEVIALRRRALALRRRIGPTVDLFGLLDGRDFPFVPPAHRAFFEDLHERVRGMEGEVDQTRDLLAEDIEAFTSVQSQHVNQIMKIFTILQVVLLPPTLIASIYGMNFKIPEYRWPFGYAYALTLMVTVVLALLAYVRRRRWLG